MPKRDPNKKKKTKKISNLTPRSVIDQINQKVQDKYGDQLSDMRSEVGGQEESVLSGASVSKVEGSGKRRLPGSPALLDNQRSSSPGSKTVSDPSGQGIVDDIQIKTMLRRKLAESADDEGRSNMEIMIDQVLYHARSGAKWAIEYITDRLEGRPGTTQMDDLDSKRTDDFLSDTIVSHLNEFLNSD